MGRTSLPDLIEKYENGDPLTMLTTYDAPTARQVDAGGVDMILVGDSVGDNHLGYDDTLPVTIDEALSNTAALDTIVQDAVESYVDDVQKGRFPRRRTCPTRSIARNNQ